MVQLTTAAALLTVAQVALYTTPALGGPIDLTGTQLEARSGAAGRIVKEMGKDHAMSKAQDLALQWKDQTLNKRPNMPSIAQQAMDKHKKEKAGQHHAPKGAKPPALPAAHKKPSIADQAKHAADAAKKHPVQSALRRQRRSLDFELEERDFDELYELAARDLEFDFLEARSGAAGRIAKEMGKDHAMSKAQDLALQWKDQTLNKRPNMPSIAQQAMAKNKKDKATHHPAPKGVKPPALPAAHKKPSIADQAKHAADAAKKHPVQSALRRQRRSLDFELEERDFDELYELSARDLEFDLLEARSGAAGRIVKEMGKDHAMSKAQDLALQWKDQTLNKRPNMASIAQQAMAKNKKDKAAHHPAPKGVKPPALPAAHKKPSIADQAKHAADAAKKHPVQSALRRQRRALEYELAERDLESLYDLVTRDLYFDMLEERSGPVGSMAMHDLD